MRTVLTAQLLSADGLSMVSSRRQPAHAPIDMIFLVFQGGVWRSYFLNIWDKGRGFWRVKEIQEKEAYLTATNSPNKERRARAIAVGEEARDEAYARFKACEEERGDQIVQAMEQAVTQNAGACVREMFKILRHPGGRRIPRTAP